MAPPYRRPEEPEGEYPVFLRHANGRYSRILPGTPHILGRFGHDNVAVFDDPRVTPHHAIVVVEGRGLRVRASGESSASVVTFVDDVCVGPDPSGSALARAGSRIRVGDTTLVVESGPVVEQQYETWRAKKREMGKRIGVSLRPVSGLLAEVPLPDLLSLCGTSKKSGVLLIRYDADIGRIHLLNGMITHASVNERDDLPAMESIHRMFEWPDGSFDLDPPKLGAPATVSFTADEVLRVALARLAER